MIELLIVVAIILIIASIAIPSLLTAKISANAASAVSSIRTLNTAQVTYQSTFPTVGYASTLAALGPSAPTGCAAGGPTSTNACVVDYTLSSASSPATAKSGYYFAVGNSSSNGLNTGYTIGGAPSAFNQTGVRGFCANEDGVIRFTASLNGSPVTTNAACMAYTPLQ